jgi:hypothetical protein
MRNVLAPLKFRAQNQSHEPEVVRLRAEGGQRRRHALPSRRDKSADA